MSARRECDVAIIGAGPAGLSAAVALKRAGVARVLVLERESEAGGVPRHCGHPPFGLREFGAVMTGPAYARRFVQRARDAGAEILTRHSAIQIEREGRLRVATPEGALDVATRRIILATGARETPRSAHLVGGRRPIGVYNTGALQAFVYLHHRLPFRRPLIVGTDLVGLSAIWTCVGHGARPVAVIEEGERPVARWPLGLFPHLCALPTHFGARVESIEGDRRVEAAIIRDRHGKTQRIACDSVLFTGAFTPESSLADLSGLAIDPRTRGPIIDQSGACSDPVCFAAGNVLRAIETAGWCAIEGERVGEVVARALRRRPNTAGALTLRAGEGVQYVVPQRLSAEAGAVQLRLSAPANGFLCARSGGRVLWRKRIRLRPHRRILAPLARIAMADLDEIEFCITPNPD